MTRQEQPTPPIRRKPSPLAFTLFVVVAFSMIMGTGPGVLLVNRPKTIAGVPLVYVWGIGWYLILVAVALVAYFVFWSKDDGDAEPSLASKTSRDQC